MEVDDTKPIYNPTRLAKLWTEWMHEWIAENLTPAQKARPWSRQTSIFGAYVMRTYGGKHFVMALWQTGITWLPTPKEAPWNYDSAIQHVRARFLTWLQTVSIAIENHKKHHATEEARRRSGSKKWQHGLTWQEQADRRQRQRARSNLNWTRNLEAELMASPGKGKKKDSKKEGRTKRKEPKENRGHGMN